MLITDPKKGGYAPKSKQSPVRWRPYGDHGPHHLAPLPASLNLCGSEAPLAVSSSWPQHHATQIHHGSPQLRLGFNRKHVLAGCELHVADNHLDHVLKM